MASLNSCSFTGRAGRDPEIRYLESGNQVANLTLAVSGFKRDAKPLWLSLTIWGKTAQVAADYVRKGSMIGVSGELEQETWTDPTTGEERSKIILNVRSLTLLDGKPKEEGSPSQSFAPVGNPPSGGYDDSDLPF